jgi:hypothetical protein
MSAETQAPFADSASSSADRRDGTLTRSVEQINRRVGRLNWEFLLSQLLMIVVAVASVYVAAREGLNQAVKFDQYQQAVREATGLQTVRREIERNREVAVTNLTRSLQLGVMRYEREIASALETIARIDEDLAMWRERESDPRYESSAPRSIERLESTRAGREQTLTRLRAGEAEFRRGLADLGASTGLLNKDGEPYTDGVDHIDLDGFVDAIWQNLRDQEFFYLWDGDLVYELNTYYTLTAAIDQKVPGTSSTGFDPDFPTRIAALYEIRVRVEQMQEMLRLTDDVLFPAIDRLIAARLALTNVS